MKDVEIERYCIVKGIVASMKDWVLSWYEHMESGCRWIDFNYISKVERIHKTTICKVVVGEPKYICNWVALEMSVYMCRD